MDELQEWCAAIDKGGMFGRRTRHDLQLVERQTAQEWSAAVRRTFGHRVTEIRSGPPDKLPDCYGEFAGRQVSIELTELGDRTALAARRAGAPGWFDISQWPIQRLAREVERRIAAKQARCLARSHQLDALVIHTDEPWLQAETIECWLQGQSFDVAKAQNINSAWLLQTHSWAVHRLFGAL